MISIHISGHWECAVHGKMSWLPSRNHIAILTEAWYVQHYFNLCLSYMMHRRMCKYINRIKENAGDIYDDLQGKKIFLEIQQQLIGCCHFIKCLYGNGSTGERELSHRKLSMKISVSFNTYKQVQITEKWRKKLISWSKDIQISVADGHICHA